MGIVVDLMAALRRRTGGRGTRAAALLRQNQQLEDKTVLERSHQTFVDSEGEPVDALVATIEPTPEQVTAPTQQQLHAVEENAARGPAFLAMFGVPVEGGGRSMTWMRVS